jgi:hypothetical protein
MSNNIQYVLEKCSYEDNLIFPPKEQLDPKLYQDFKKIMVQNLGKWKGGKKQFFEFPFQTHTLKEKFFKGERPNFKQDWHFFPTPDDVIDQMCNITIPSPDCRILEPSAGQGDIIKYVNDFIKYQNPFDWTVIEPHPLNREKLKSIGYPPDHDFFETYQCTEPFDLIYANPPFKHIHSHIEKMFSCLDKYGVITAIVPSSFKSQYKKEWNDKYFFQFFPLNKGSFKSSGTMVETEIVKITFFKS